MPVCLYETDFSGEKKKCKHPYPRNGTHHKPVRIVPKSNLVDRCVFVGVSNRSMGARLHTEPGVTQKSLHQPKSPSKRGGSSGKLQAWSSLHNLRGKLHGSEKSLCNSTGQNLFHPPTFPQLLEVFSPTPTPTPVKKRVRNIVTLMFCFILYPRTPPPHTGKN